MTLGKKNYHYVVPGKLFRPAGYNATTNTRVRLQEV